MKSPHWFWFLLAEHFVYWLEWIDIHLMRCRWRWFCFMVQLPAWTFQQRALDRLSVDELTEKYGLDYVKPDG